MTGPDPIDPRPDERLGHLLREYLTAPDPAGFRWRVMAALRREPAPSSWDVLTAWFRPGLAAAAVLLVALGLWLSRGTPAADAVSLEEALRPSSEVAGLMAGPRPSSPDGMLAVVLGEGR